jgi:NAD-dependent dihydropyrimidine dehydrogenase PreA subunit
MIRKIIKIDDKKCNGCGLCARACKEGAISIIDGKAKLLRDDYCDGLGNCLPVCPTAAISFEEREAAVFKTKQTEQKTLPCGCPGSNARSLVPCSHEQDAKPENKNSELRQWPIQIQLVPVNAPYFDKSRLLITADCAAYAYGEFHSQFMKNKITLIGCPKLDNVDYSEKLTAIISGNDIKSVTVVRMEVPCCAGIEKMAITALKNSGKFIPWQVIILSSDGNLIEG